MHKEPIAHRNTSQPSDDIDQGPLIQAVIDLHIARRTLLIYPITHEQVKRSIIKAFKNLGQILSRSESITLVVLKEGIAVGDQVLESKSPVLADFAGILKDYEIATLSIQKAVAINELGRFLQLICLDREKIVTRGGITTVVEKLAFRGISVQAVDYSQLQLTEEEEIRRISDETGEKGSVWHQFVSNLTAAKSTKTGRISSNIDPGNLARMINRAGLDVNLAVQHYQSAISAATGTGHRSLERELMAFQDLIRALDDDLRAQFLSTTFDHCGQLADASDAVHLIDGLGGDLIVEMLSQASAAGKKISPSLLSFIKKMGHAGGQSAKPSSGDDSRVQGFSAESVSSLLAHEQYDTYVDSDYVKLLDQLTGAFQAGGSLNKPQSLKQEISGALTGAGIHTHAGRAIVQLMINSIEIAEYRDWARQLAYLLDDLIEHGAYGYLTEVMTQVRLEKKRKDPERAEIAGLVLDRFSDPQFVAKAIDSVPSSIGEADPAALAFFLELGEPVVVEIFDGLDPNQTFHEQNMLTHILKNLKSLTAQEALERLKDPRTDYVRRMIRIIRKMGDSATADQIRTLMDHDDMGIRMEALATLLAFNNKWGLVRLRDLLSDPLGEGFDRAAELAGRYRVRAAVSQLESVAAQRGDAAPRESAIRALGQIGDPRAIPTLTKIANTRWALAKASTRHLKQVVFETLDRYPAESIHDLVRSGLKQKDAAIRASCERLLRKSDKGVGAGRPPGDNHTAGPVAGAVRKDGKTGI